MGDEARVPCAGRMVGENDNAGLGAGICQFSANVYEVRGLAKGMGDPAVDTLLVTAHKYVPAKQALTSYSGTADVTLRSIYLDPVGAWGWAMPPLPGIVPDTLLIRLAVSDDATFDFTVVEQRSGHMVAQQAGTWTVADDSVRLVGARCAVLDTTADPDTLAAIAATDCARPSILELPTSDTWEVLLGNLNAAILGAFRAPPDYMSVLSELSIPLSLEP